MFQVFSSANSSIVSFKSSFQLFMHEWKIGLRPWNRMGTLPSTDFATQDGPTALIFNKQ